MSINITHFRRLSKKRRDEKRYETKPIGSAIKFKRKELNMTLEEGATGICSVSYLSKLENNLIEPNIDFIEKLMKKFDISENSYNDLNNYIEDLDVLIKSMINQKKPYIDLSSSYKDRKDFQSLLIDIIHQSILKNDSNVLKSYSDIKSFIPNLNNLEYSLLILSLSDLLIRSDKFQDAYEILLFEPVTNKDSDMVPLLLKRNKLICSFHTNKISEIITHYQRYIDLLYQTQNYHLIHEISKMYVMYMTYYQSTDEIIGKLEYLNSFSESDKNTLLVKTYYFDQQYEKILEIMSNDSFENIESIMIYLMTLDILGKKNTIKEIIERTSKNRLNHSFNLLSTYLTYKYLENKNQTLDYLRREMITLKRYTDHYILLEYIMMDSQNIFSKNHYYKEASQITKELYPVLKNLRKGKNRIYDEG